MGRRLSSPEPADQGLLSTRGAAQAAGSKFFFNGRPCKRGHVSRRYSGDGGCVECAIDRVGTWNASNPGKALARAKANYWKDPESKIALVKARRERDPARTRLDRRAEYERHRGAYIERSSRRWREKPAAILASAKAFRQRNVARFTHLAKLSTLQRLKRSPPWLTAEHKRQIREFYLDSRRRSLASGVRYNVDHIIPLRGKNVSGLHVPWNLQVIPERLNKSKSNKF